MFASTRLCPRVAVLILLAMVFAGRGAGLRPVNKPGYCPLLMSAAPEGGSHRLDRGALGRGPHEECHSDWQCGTGPEKCCATGACCGTFCTKPLQHPPIYWLRGRR